MGSFEGLGHGGWFHFVQPASKSSTGIMTDTGGGVFMRDIQLWCGRICASWRSWTVEVWNNDFSELCLAWQRRENEDTGDLSLSNTSNASDHG